MEWPDWWRWELEIAPRMEKRMEDRGFSETDLRAMLQDASAIRPDIAPGRWVVETRFAGSEWEVIVEPDKDERLLVAVTAYPTRVRP